MSIITLILILVVIGVGFFLVYLAIAKWKPGTPAAVAGIILALVFLLIILQLTGVLGDEPRLVRPLR